MTAHAGWKHAFLSFCFIFLHSAEWKIYNKIHRTSDWLHKIQNVTKACIYKGMSKWVKKLFLYFKKMSLAWTLSPSSQQGCSVF